MKKMLLLMLISTSLVAGSQMKEGRIVYERTMVIPMRTMNINGQSVSDAPPPRTDHFELLFGNNQSLWQTLPSIAGDETSVSLGGGGGMMIRVQGANDVSYVNFDRNTKVDHREVMDRSFIVTDSITKLNWKLTNENKTILGHNAVKATSTRISTRSRMTMENGEMKRSEFPDTATVVAWFATDMPVAAGPEFQGQLPGIILELNIDNGQTTYRATEISPKVNVNKIREPKDGKKMTAAEFSKERNRIMEEMRKNMQGGRPMQFSVQQ